MIPVLALALPRENEWTALVWFVVFFVVPALGRLFKWLGQRTRDAGGEGAGLGPREERRRQREERRRAELEGEELWRRLARGEELALPVPVEVSREATEEPTAEDFERRVLEPVRSEASLEREPEVRSLEREAVAGPLAALGRVVEPGEAPEISLESETPPEPLAAFAQAEARGPEGRAGSPLRLRRGELGRAIVLSEILGPPVCDRPMRV